MACAADCTTFFEKAGYRAVTVSDAPSALSVIHKEPCDLVVLDLEIEGVDGLAFCRLLRAQPATSKLPVIALSDDDLESRRSKLYRRRRRLHHQAFFARRTHFSRQSARYDRRKENGS